MNFLKNNPRISFLYGGKSFLDCTFERTVTENENELITVYTFENGLKLTNIAKKYDKYGAYEWVNWLENTSEHPTQVVSELWDCDCELPMEQDEPARWTAYQPDPEKVTRIYVPHGATCHLYDFCPTADESATTHYIFPGQTKDYQTSGGRGANGDVAPFFNVHRQGAGFIVAIGWTGQWNAKFTRTDYGMRIQSKIEDTHFLLYPGEKIRTSSVVIMPYTGSIIDSQNKWRRLVRDHFSLIGKPGRDTNPPFCAGIWGGMSTKGVLDRIKACEENEIPFDNYWMDAGWYGTDTRECPDEFEGDWGSYTGDWRINPYHHPDQLQDVVSEIKKAGKKFLLWFEPERVLTHTPIFGEHPEYFLDSPHINDGNRLLNLGNPDALSYLLETLSGLIQELNLSWYRQDFNFEPLSYWRNNDSTHRRGITEIKHIMGLYQLWDSLLERFPNLMIDNCASGGRRIDIETLRRSVPLWRSDAQCSANHQPEYSQNHNISYSCWMPYSGTGTGRGYDIYRFRSTYAPGIMTQNTFSERDSFGDDPEKMAFLKRCADEYLKVRPYLQGDIYPLCEVSHKMDTWCAVQYYRPESDDGIVQVFRRPKSPITESTYPLRGISADCRYRFTDADDNSVKEFDGKELIENGFPVRIATRRTAKVYFYEKI